MAALTSATTLTTTDQLHHYPGLNRGYTTVQSATYAVAASLSAGIAAMGRFTLLFDGAPSTGIPAVTWTLTDGTSDNLFDLAEELRTRGWLVPAYTLPPDQEAVTVQRIVMRHGFSLDMADLLLDDMRRSIAKLDNRPPSRGLEPEEGTGFHHDAVAAVPAALLSH